MTRKRHRFDLECERAALTRRMNIYRMLHLLRPYYFDVAWRLDHIADALFPGEAAKHSSEYELDTVRPLDHDDEHDGYPFHIHVPGIMPERVLVYLQAGQILILLYNLIIACVFLYHSKIQPRIVNSVKAQKRIQRRYTCIWLPCFLLFAVFLLLVSYLVYYVRLFSSLWIEQLQEHDKFYSCTNEVLRIDLMELKNMQHDAAHFSLTFILFANLCLLMTMLTNFLAHTYTMLTWYKLNPADGNLVARDIQVGLPAEAQVPGNDNRSSMGSLS